MPSLLLLLLPFFLSFPKGTCCSLLLLLLLLLFALASALAFASAFAFLSVIPEGNLLFASALAPASAVRSCLCCSLLLLLLLFASALAPASAFAFLSVIPEGNLLFTMPREYHFWVYILASRSRNLYIGMTNSLNTRLAAHRGGIEGTHTAHYNIHRLVHYEYFSYVRSAISREKELKTWTREQKIALIEAANPTWNDLIPAAADAAAPPRG